MTTRQATANATARPPIDHVPIYPDMRQPPFNWRPVIWFVAVLAALIVFFH